MDDPLKVIFKYKNNNRRNQYHIYIFTGDIPSNIMTILKKIENKSLIDTFLSLDVNDIKKLDKFYGDFWYKKFFNTYHLNYSIYQIKRNTTQMQELTKKLGKDWVATHIEHFNLIEKKLFYSYEATIKDDKMRKEQHKKPTIGKDDDKIIDYRTIQPFNVADMLSKTMVQRPYVGTQLSRIEQYEQSPSSDESVDLKDLSDDDEFMNRLVGGEFANTDVEYEDIDTSVEAGADTADEEAPIDPDEGIDPGDIIFDEELDLEDIGKLYQDVQPDENILQTTSLIKNALQDDKIFKKQRTGMIEFDTSKDDLMYNENLRDVYNKKYVTSQYIFKDDTIKMIKGKICCSIKNNPKFEKDAFIIPSRQYIYSEYIYDDQIEKVMIGQKWIRRTDLLKIDVEPNDNIRYYEELRGNLKLLRDNIKRYGSKIKWEDDDYNILYDYEGYFTNNEIYLIDIYNELGKGYNPDPEALRNITDVFIRVYYPKFKIDDIKYLISYLNNDTTVESNKISAIYETINNDIIMENQIMNDVELIKKTTEYKKLFTENYIIQSVIHVNLRIQKNKKIDLFRLFNEFVVDSKYPFIQYQTADGQIIFKYSEQDIADLSASKDNIDILSKWFENAPYGISFKVKITERGVGKYMGINLGDNGRIEYKTRWKEEDAATITDIKKTYQYVKDLVIKLNAENNRVTFDVPDDNEFKYAFINSIQKFILPDKFTINHNDLSEFARYFYPYVALVIEPRKRQSKIKKDDTISKFGTYLRYKRMSKYENQSKIEQRILYFMRNYDYNDQSLSNEISKQFNITVERAMEQIEKVRAKYPNLKKSRKILKKLENIPKYKPPGIGIDIQGRQADRYKIRISGARSKDQLDRIITFMNILIYLYIETYLYKRPERQIMKEKLKKLTNIAKRRNKVEEVIKQSEDGKSVKQITALDKKRLGFKPEKGQNQWTRSCQNSGTEKRRRPQTFTSIDDLLAEGFKLNKNTGLYEKTVKLKLKNGKTRDIMIKAVGLPTGDENDPDKMIYYSCNPKDNGEHTYVGFLSRSNNPFGQVMPCCFKKDPFTSKNKIKRDLYLRSIGKIEGPKQMESTEPKILGEQLYILQDTNKIQEGRFGFLPKYLDFFLNQALENDRIIKQHYLVKTNGYYFKYGVKQDEHPFLGAIASVLQKSMSEIRAKLVNILEEDKQDVLFTALNNGDIKTRYETREKFIHFIKTSNKLNFDILNHFMSIPSVLSKNGLNIIVFEKNVILIRESLEKEKIREDFNVMCQNLEEINNIIDTNRDNILMIKEEKAYYPIVKVIKKTSDSKNVEIERLYKYANKEDNIINHIKDFYYRNCQLTVSEDIIDTKHIRSNLNAKKLYSVLSGLDKKYKPRYQVIDARNKCKYIITDNSTIVPTRPSGSIYNLPILKHILSKTLSFNETYDNLIALQKVTNEISVKPIGVYYSQKTKDSVTVIAMMTEIYDSVPVKPETLKIMQIASMGLVIENKQLYDKIDEELSKGKSNVIIDERTKRVKYDLYYNESYQLFRLEFSKFIAQPNNEHIKKRIVKTITEKGLSKKDKMDKLEEIIYRIIDKELYNLFLESKQDNNQSGGKADRFVSVINKIPDVKSYEIDNNREICEVHTDKDVCNNNVHCRWSYDNCYFALTREMIIHFVNKLSDELAYGGLKADELLNKGNYFVSDIVDYNVFTQRPGQKIIKNTNTSLNKLLYDIFGKEHLPKIGKRRLIKGQSDELEEMNIKYPLRDMGEMYIQKIIDNNLTVLRAYANGYSWLKHRYYDLENRNLGYYSALQTDLANYFKSVMLDWLIDKRNVEDIKLNLLYYMKDAIDLNEINPKIVKEIILSFINKISRDVLTTSNGIVEYYVMSKIYNIPIIVYNDINNIIYVFDNGIVYDTYKTTNKNIDKYRQPEYVTNAINIKFTLADKYSIPYNIESIYYK